MNFEENSVLYKKAFNFALDIIKTYRYLMQEKREFILSKQLLRSGTSIGANISESFNAQSTKDFVSKLSISLKEAGESQYWIKLLTASNIIDSNITKPLIENSSQIIRILSSIIKKYKCKILNYITNN